jgi:TBC1 domain-containing protein 4
VRFTHALDLRDHYKPDMGSLHVELYQLMRILHDVAPDLSAHLDLHGIDAFLFATPWFITCFASQFPINLVQRIFGESQSAFSSIWSLNNLNGVM